MEEVGIAFVPQYKFAKEAMGRLWSADFAILDRRLLLEVEGGTWMQAKVQPDGTVVTGHHSHPVGYENDCIKYNAAAILGWRVLRFTTKMVNDRRAIQTIQRILGLDTEPRTWEEVAQRQGVLLQPTKGDSWLPTNT